MGLPSKDDNTWFEIEQYLATIETPIVTHDKFNNPVIIERGKDNIHGRYYQYSTYLPSNSETVCYVGVQIFYEDGTTYTSPSPITSYIN